MNWDIQYVPDFSVTSFGREAVVTVSFSDNGLLALALSALKEDVARKVRFFSDTGGLAISHEAGRTTAILSEDSRKLAIELCRNDLDYLLHFTMTGLVRGHFDVDHIDLEFGGEETGVAGTLIFKFSPATAAVSSADARKLLGF